MRNVQLDNCDLLVYFNTINELKNHPSMDEYRAGYRTMHLHMKSINIDLHILRCVDWIRKDNLSWIALLVSLIL